MKYEIAVKVRFRAGHRLLNYEGKCARLHGEGYTAIFVFEAEVLDKRGMVLDFGEVKREIKGWIDEQWDHTVILNMKDKLVEVLEAEGQKVFRLPYNPTAENMAHYLYVLFKKQFPELKKVGIIESWDDSVAWYGGEK